MSTNTNVNSATAGVQEPAAVTPEAIVEQLRAVRQLIPEYTQLAIPDAKAIHRVAHLNSDFIDAAINAVGASQVVQTAVGSTDANLREENDQAGRWTAVEDELRAMLKGVVAANLIRRHRVGLAALQAYNISRQLVRKEDHADLWVPETSRTLTGDIEDRLVEDSRGLFGLGICFWID